jgi:dipeptidyl aminopeptidase/acylaminoacyl peptidase
MDVEKALKLKTPAAMAWSPDGQQIAYQVTGAEGSEIYLYSVRDDATKLLVPDIAPYRYWKEGADLRWTPGGKRVVYTTGRDFYTVSVDGGEPQLLVSGILLGELVQLAPGQDKVSFIRDGELWCQDVHGSPPRKLTKGEGLLQQDPELFSRLYQWPQWSPDGAKIAYLSPTERSAKVMVISVDGEEIGRVVPEDDIWGHTIVEWSPDSQSLAISRLSQDFQKKQLTVCRLDDGAERQIWLDTDELWVDHNINPSFRAAWSHEGDRLAFLSNRDGWRHLYVAHLDTGEMQQLTQGDYEVYWCGWSPDDTEIVYISSQGQLQHWLLWSIPASGGPARQLVTRPGICSSGYLLRFVRGAPAHWAPAGDTISYTFSGLDEPFGLWTVDRSGEGSPVQFYSGVPEGMEASDMAHMEAVAFESADGTKVPAVLITSKGLRTDEKHPALVHMYGGWGQMASLGWGLLFKSTLFNYLASRGYVILIVDPRGSEGYGDAYAKGLCGPAGDWHFWTQLWRLPGCADDAPGTGGFRRWRSDGGRV